MAALVLLLGACGGSSVPGAADKDSRPAATASAASAVSASRRAQKLAAGDLAGPPTLTVLARGAVAAGTGPIIDLRVNGVSVGTAEVRNPQVQEYSFAAPGLAPGATVEVVFTNPGADAVQRRVLTLAAVFDAASVLVPSAPGVVYDRGSDAAAFDGLDLLPGQEAMPWSGAMRFVWPAAPAPGTAAEAAYAASRFLQQASFGPTRAGIERLKTLPFSAWIDEQMAMPATPDFVNHVQLRFDLGPDYRPPNGARYTPTWVEETFWTTAATAPDQLRRRVAYALHQIFVTSLADSGLYYHGRAYANFMDMLGRQAFGNFRDLLEEVALSPVMGIYLSHLRNQKEDPLSGRQPDENFAREVMQLFSIGLVELYVNATPRTDAAGRPIETYTNADVRALASVFTGWSWGLDDGQLTENNFRYAAPDYDAVGADRIDLRRMKAYPGMNSALGKTLFAGKPNAVAIAANAGGSESLRLALDALFRHPNVGPFISRQLIQRLVTSNPSAAYVARVARVFNDNGWGVRGDMAAVVRAILLDIDARSAPSGPFGRLREPVLRIAHWMRAFGATSLSGNYMIGTEMLALGQRPLFAPSVFNFYRPGYVPPNTALATYGQVAPEMQIVNESTTAVWVNLLEQMEYVGLGWNGSTQDVVESLADESTIVAGGADAFVEHLNLMLYGGQMSAFTRACILDAMFGVDSRSPTRDRDRARAAIFIAMASPEYQVQR